MAVLCGFWTLLMFALLALWGCRLVDAVLFTVLAQISAASMFWFAVPETASFGSATIIAALILTIWPQHVHALVRYAGAIALSLSMTVTNVMVGLIAAARRLPGRDMWIVVTGAWFIVTMLWVLQDIWFPPAEFFLPPRFNAKYVFAPTFPRIWDVLTALVSNGIVMPDIEVISGPELHANHFVNASAESIMSVQRSLPGSGGLAGLIATLTWVALAGLGVWAAVTARSGLSTLCLLIAGVQIALHLRFGSETFLHTMHVLPLLIVIAATATFTRLRTASLALAAVVVLAGGANNWQQFQIASLILHEQASARLPLCQD